MKRNFKRTLAALIATTTLTVGIGSINANAASTSASWSASHVNVYGAPSSSSTSPVVEIMQSDEGAKAVCNSVSHSNTDAYIGYTYINCTNYSMQEVTIRNTNPGYCYPSVGFPLVDIPVKYKVTASTTSYPDVFWSRGTITKL